MTRDEHLAFCKARALEYLDAGDLGNALASMGSDLSKHPETQNVGLERMALGMRYAIDGDAAGLRRWVEGFR
jgi:hypothetical protein